MPLKNLFQPHSSVLSLIIVVLLLPCVMELVLYLGLHHPTMIQHFPYVYRAVVHNYYMHELDIVQYRPQCASYDSQLFYIMKPGECRHRSVEFDCLYSINKMGLRDDDASLDRPEIITLGDSYTMGWGMKNESIFPSLIEEATGMRTLNVSVSSYGTAREFLLLDRLDVSNLKYLIIQYCTNDFEENKQYVDDGFKLNIHSEEFYETTVRNHINRVKYRPFLYLSTVLNVIWTRIFEKEDLRATKLNVANAGFIDNALVQREKGELLSVTSLADSVRSFLEILNSRNHLDGVKVIVMNISGLSYTTPAFIQALSTAKDDESYPLFIRNMQLIDIGEFIDREDYFILDCHLNESGHRKVADLLLNIIKPEAEVTGQQ